MKRDLHKFTAISILVAVTFILQILATFLPIKIGGTALSFTLIPIIVAAVFYGVSGGAIVGFSFGAIVFIMGITGADAFTLWCIEYNWFFTLLATVVRTTLCGVLVAVIFNALRARINKKAAYYVAAVCAPVINTGIFVLLFMALFSKSDKMAEIAASVGYTNFIAFTVLFIAGLNFLFELATTVLLAPPVCIALERVIRRKKS